MSKIFLSHSSRDSAKALALATWLEEEGWSDYFLDLDPEHGLAPGARWQDALRQAADRCEAVVFLVSPAWRDSKWCLAEFLLAKQLGKTILGVVIEATPLDTLPSEVTATWQLCDLAHGEARYTCTVAHDPVVPRTEVSLARAGLDRLRIGLQRAGLDPSTFPWPPPGDPERLPYRGLKALEAADAAVFFGREAAIVRGLDALRALRERGVERMLVILGASGAGKSSFLRAGLWPRLQRNDRLFLTLPVVRPARAALGGAEGLAASLEAALRRYGVVRARGEIRRALHEKRGLVSLVQEIQTAAKARLDPEAAPPTVVIPVDQGEELFSADGGEEARILLERLAELLAPAEHAAAETKPSVLAVVAIRSDGYQRLQEAPALAHVRPQLFDLRPMAPAEYKAVIEGPAARTTAAGRKLVIEPALTERLLEDAVGADATPLLAFTLERLLIEYGSDGDLRLDEYEKLGGIRGSIEAAIAEALADPARAPAIPAEEAERDRLLRAGLIPWLARIDAASGMALRREARREEIPAQALPVLERLVEARLLLRDRREREDGPGREIFEVAHEALLREWPKLLAWLDEEREALEAADTVERAAAEWHRNGRTEEWLVHAAGRLRVAEDLLCRDDYKALLAGTGLDYLEACRAREEAALQDREAKLAAIAAEQERVEQEQEKTARAQRRGRWLLAAVALVTLLAGAWVVQQTRTVSRERSVVLANDARKQADERRYDSALRLAVLGARSSLLSPASPEAAAQLARAAHASAARKGLFRHAGSVFSAAFSPDGRRVVTAASSDQSARVWDATTGDVLARLEGHEGSAARIAVCEIRRGARAREA